MKILIIAEGLWPPQVNVTGISAVYELQKRLCAKKHIELHLFTVIEKWADPSWRLWMKNEEKRTEIRFHYMDLGFFKEMVKLHFYASKIIYLPMIMKLQSQFDFDIIHEYSSTPILVRRTSMYRQIFKTRTFHTLWTYNFGLLGSFRFLGGKVDGIICATHHMKNLLRETNPKSKIMHIPIGIDISKFNRNQDTQTLKHSLDLSSGDPVILYIGLIEERKGIFTLLKAASLVLKEHPNAMFIIVTYPLEGNFYSYRQKRRELLQCLGTNRRRFRLLEGMQDIPLLMSLADIFVLPLKTAHGVLGYPRVLQEAMASSKAIIASDTPGAVELITNEENGILFRKGDVEGLANAIGILISNEELRNRLGENARTSVKQYDWDLIVDRLEKVYLDF